MFQYSFILYVESIDETGAKIKRYWNRSKKAFTINKNDMAGWHSFPIACGQETRMTKRNFMLPKNETLTAHGVFRIKNRG